MFFIDNVPNEHRNTVYYEILKPVFDWFKEQQFDFESARCELKKVSNDNSCAIIVDITVGHGPLFHEPDIECHVLIHITYSTIKTELQIGAYVTPLRDSPKNSGNINYNCNINIPIENPKMFDLLLEYFDSITKKMGKLARHDF